MSAQDGQQARLSVAGIGGLYFLAQLSAGAESVRLRCDQIAAGADQDRIEPGVLAAGHGQVPAVDEHVEEPVAGVDRARDRSVGDRGRAP